MLNKELAGLRADVEKLRNKNIATDVAILCAIVESFAHEDTILLMAEQILRERNVVATEFVHTTKHPGEYEYDPQGDVVKLMIHDGTEGSEPTDLGDHESILHAYHTAPVPRLSRH